MALCAMTERCCRTAARNQAGWLRRLLTPHQQSWMENSTRQGARTPGQGRQFKNSSIRRATRATSPQGEAFRRTDFQTFPYVLTGEILSKISPQGLFTVECFLWKSPRLFIRIFPLWKARNLSTRGCGGAALAIPGFAPLFHIKSYYYCCCYIYPLFL